jgi:hypothetical protein
MGQPAIRIPLAAALAGAVAVTLGGLAAGPALASPPRPHAGAVDLVVKIQDSKQG